MNADNNTTSLFWYDYETFGTNPRRDRVAQFAGIRTDLRLNPVDEPVVQFCRPTDDYLPDPRACVMTGITPKEATVNGVPELEFIARVLDELGAPGTCSVGYNSIRFDDEFTRFTAWRNFHDPYRHQWANSCSRWDIIDVARLAYALRPDGVEWPLKESGSPSFKLEDLARANGLEQAQAHDALSDVRTTLALARLILETNPRLYEWTFMHRSAKAARKLVDVEGHTPVLHISRRYPAKRGCMALVMPLAPHPVNDSAVLVYDLRDDPEPLLTLSAQEVHGRVFTPQAELPDDVRRIPIKAVAVNKCPVIAPAKMVEDIPEERAAAFELDLVACRRHEQMLEADIEAVAAKARRVFQMREFPPVNDPEQDLYGGSFLSDEDRRRCDAIRQMSGDDLANFNAPFDDPRLSTLLFRFRARNHPDTLTDAERQRWETWRVTRLEKAPDGGLTLSEYDGLIEELSREVGTDPEKMQVLMDLKEWGAGVRPVSREE